MRPLTRQGLRLASPSQERSCRFARTQIGQRRRRLSISSRRSSFLPRNPSDTAETEHSQNGTRHNEEHDRTDEKEESAGNNAETGEPVSAPPRLRRTLRQRRMGEYPREIPRPPPIPQWFLENNVRLSSPTRQGRISVDAFLNKRLPKIVACKETTTGKVLFTLPYSRASLPDPTWYDVVAMVLAVKGKPGLRPGSSPNIEGFLSRLASIHQIKPGLYLDRTLSPEPKSNDKQEPGMSNSQVPVQTAQGRLQENGKEESPPIKASAVSGPVTQSLNSSPDPQRGQGGKVSQESKEQTSHVTDQETKDSAKNSSTNTILDFMPPNLRKSLSTMSWPFLELQLGIEAALALPANCANLSSFAASRVDMSLVCSDARCHDNVDQLVRRLADSVGADIITLDANDLEDLTADYVGQGRDGPNAFSTFGYKAFREYVAPSANGAGSSAPATAEDDLDPEDEDGTPVAGLGQAQSLLDHLNKIAGGMRIFVPSSSGVTQGLNIHGLGIGSPQASRRLQTVPVDDTDDRVTALFDSILDAAKEKPRSIDTRPEEDSRNNLKTTRSPEEKAWVDIMDRGYAAALSTHIPVASNLQRHTRFSSLALIEHLAPLIRTQKLSVEYTERSVESQAPIHKTIVHVRDLKEIAATQTGEGLIKHLLGVVQKRRQAGESIMIVASTVQDGLGSSEFTRSEDDVEAQFRVVKVPAMEGSLLWDDMQLHQDSPWAATSIREPASRRILELNFRHIQSMLRRLFPEVELNLGGGSSMTQLCTPGSKEALSERVLSIDEVQRLILLAYGLTQSLAKSQTVEPVHIGLATMFTLRSDQLVQRWTEIARKKAAANANGTTANSGQFGQTPPNNPDQGQKVAFNAHETKLLTGVVNAKNIKVGFADVHATPDTIEALKTMTTLALARPDAFKYGVLAADRLPGVLLYGPPGTGKTLLAKAVAKESGATVLEVSGAQIYEKYVGEGEKMVRAVFSLAKKMSPCVVFMDEADALFCARQSSGGRNTHREIINQFLREWDGMDDHNVLMMVASNRPFDLDDAVLRRLPRRLLVDLPVTKDRESILGIHLKNELLSDEVSLPKLAEQTPLYSGSDLKNLCVAAALACVREENDLAESKKQAGEEFKFPERRTLHVRHFDRALTEISASINEDMSTLSAIRKFDERYGDRRGRKKKSAYGFGNAEDVKHDENAARVRHGSVPPAESPPTAPAAP